MSNRVIHKAVVSSAGVRLPNDAVPLSVQTQHGQITVWYTTSGTPSESTAWCFYVGTGHVINDQHTYVGTVHDDGFVWHVFLERAA